MIYSVEELLPVFGANFEEFCDMSELEQIDFVEKYAPRAEKYIDRLSFYRLKNAAADFPDDVKLAICIVSELMHKDAVSGNVVSENTDGYAVTYKDSMSVHLKGKIIEVCKDYLEHTGIFQRSMGVI